MIDHSCYLGVDARQRVAGREAIRTGGDDVLGLTLASLRAALGAAGADQIGDVQALAFRRQSGCGRAHAGEDLLADLRYQCV